ncbi:MAG: penicillin-binding protein 2, partial [Microscillaceae bacterium]|nr:penicillin-binding protein 2 [Microscillaceae bacterium]MDW8460738.1 penicillin-binding protein 2 [Cytophagales bacterium]
MREDRKWVILGLFFFVAIVFLGKLFALQVLDSTYKQAADNNAFKRIIIYPHRGMVYDRTGKLLIYNTPVYDLLVTPSKVSIKDTTAFCNLLGISKEYFIKTMQQAMRYSMNVPSDFLRQISHVDFAKIQDKLIDYTGFDIVTRTIRAYPHQSLANTLGYIGEIDSVRLKKDSEKYYQRGDYIGISGLEQVYEKELRGRKGVKYVMVDAKGREKGSFRNGQYDTLSIAGKDLISSIDLELQQYGEYLMQNKVGSIVAIEPATGEILAIVSSPSYDPNLLTGANFAKNYSPLVSDKRKPLFNRAIMSTDPPGSVFKVVQALVGLQERVIVPESRFFCNWSLVKCHGHPSPLDVRGSLQYSCNPYYYNVFRRIVYQNILNDSLQTAPDQEEAIGFEKWRNYMLKFGLGDKLGVDIANEKGGRIPKTSLYDKRYGKGKWKYSNIYSLAIGQGEIGVTPLQMANIACIIANRGWYRIPHVIKKLDKEDCLPQYRKKIYTDISPKHFEVIIDGMEWAVKAGTVASYAIAPDLNICGKTGTVQNPRGEDHSVFIAFAPKENPKIAIAVYVENAGFGGVWAAPIATLMIEKY